VKRTFLVTLLLSLASTAIHASTIEMKVHGMVCGFCAQGIEKSLRKLPATADVTVSLENQLVAVSTRDGTDITDADLHKLIEEAGYDLKQIVRTNRPMKEIREQVAQKN
jgi:copper chaperone CopZ